MDQAKAKFHESHLLIVKFTLDMDIDTINAMSDPLRQIQLATSSWDDGSLGDEDVYSACDEMHSICVTILTKLDDLLDEDEDGDNSDKESMIDIKFNERFSQSQGCPEGHLCKLEIEVYQLATACIFLEPSLLSCDVSLRKFWRFAGGQTFCQILDIILELTLEVFAETYLMTDNSTIQMILERARHEHQENLNFLDLALNALTQNQGG
jgi:hypothetical protein